MPLPLAPKINESDDMKDKNQGKTIFLWGHPINKQVYYFSL
jgi:hypothetical protein